MIVGCPISNGVRWPSREEIWLLMSCRVMLDKRLSFPFTSNNSLSFNLRSVTSIYVPRTPTTFPFESRNGILFVRSEICSPVGVL